MNARAAGQKVELVEIDLPDGEPTDDRPGRRRPARLSLLLNRDGRAVGKDYDDASGWLRVTAGRDGRAAVALRFVPEIHHGPVQARLRRRCRRPGRSSRKEFMHQGRPGRRSRSATWPRPCRPARPGRRDRLPGRGPPRARRFLFTQPEPTATAARAGSS